MPNWFRRRPPAPPPLPPQPPPPRGDRDIPQLGQFKWSNAVSQWMKTEKTALPLFDGAEVMLDIDLFDVEEDEPFSPDVIAVTLAFLQLGPEAREAITPHVWLKYTEFRDAAGDLPVTIARPEDVWRHVTPGLAFVTRGLVGRWHVLLQCDCSWAGANSLHLVLRDGVRWVRVSHRGGPTSDGDQFNRPALDAWMEDPNATLPLLTARELEEAVRREGGNWDLFS